MSVSLEDVLKLSKTLGSLEITSQGDPELLRVGGWFRRKRARWGCWQAV